MKNLSMLLKVLLVVALLGFLSGCEADENKESENKLTFNKGDNMLLYYKDANIELEVVITLRTNPDKLGNNIVFSGIKHGKTARDSFPVSGLISSPWNNEVRLVMSGISMNGKKLIPHVKFYLPKDGENYIDSIEESAPMAYAEIKPVK